MKQILRRKRHVQLTPHECLRVVDEYLLELESVEQTPRIRTEVQNMLEVRDLILADIAKLSTARS